MAFHDPAVAFCLPGWGGWTITIDRYLRDGSDPIAEGSKITQGTRLLTAGALTPQGQATWREVVELMGDAGDLPEWAESRKGQNR